MEKTTESVENLITTAQLLTAIQMLGEVGTLAPRFAKQVLTRMESDGILTAHDEQSAVIRKHVLDGFGDMRRALLEVLREIPVQD